MHHSLRLYSKHRKSLLRYYIFQARWTKIPLIGRAVRRVANLYGEKASSGYLLTLNEAEQIIDAAGALAVGPCACRQVFHHCDTPVQTEIMVGGSRAAFAEESPADYREITKQEAKDLLRDCHRRGLIQTVMRCREHFYAICNCCPCCCVPLRLSKKYGIGNALTRHPDIVAEFKGQQGARVS